MADTRNIVTRSRYEALVAEVAAGTKTESDLDSVYVVLIDPPGPDGKIVTYPDGSPSSSVITGRAVVGKVAQGYRLPEPVAAQPEPVAAPPPPAPTIKRK